MSARHSIIRPRRDTFLQRQMESLLEAHESFRAALEADGHRFCGCDTALERIAEDALRAGLHVPGVSDEAFG